MVRCRCDRPLLVHQHLIGVYQQVHRFGTAGPHFYYMVAGEVMYCSLPGMWVPGSRLNRRMDIVPGRPP